ncbi:unnamed protein product [Calypogeia fissa]
MEIIHCQQLEGFLNSLGSLQGLEDLRLLSCVCFKTLQNTLGQLRTLLRFEIWHYDWKALVGIVGKLWVLKELVIRNCSKHRRTTTICQQIEFLESLDSSGLLQRVENVDLPKYIGYSVPDKDTQEQAGHIHVFVRYPEHQPNQERGTFWLEESRDLWKLLEYRPYNKHLLLKDFSKLQTLLHFLERRLGISEFEIIMYDSEQFPGSYSTNRGLHRNGVVTVFIRNPTKLKSFLYCLERLHGMHVRSLIADVRERSLTRKNFPDILQQFREVLGVLWDFNSWEELCDTGFAFRALHRQDIHSGQARDGNCAGQLLTVRCSGRSNPSSASSSQTYTPEMMGTHRFKQQNGDCFLKMPQESECEMMSTRVERSTTIPVLRWDDDDDGERIIQVPVVVSADTTLSCCLVSDHNKRKLRIEFLQIGGQLKYSTNTLRGLLNDSMLDTSVRTSVYAYINNSQDREDEEIVLDLHGEFPASTMRVKKTDDFLSLKRSGIWVKDSHPGSTTLELRWDGWLIDQVHHRRPTHFFLFTEHHPVTLEGELPDYFNAALSINFDLRYQFEFFASPYQEKTVVDFDCVFQFRTKEILSDES